MPRLVLALLAAAPFLSLASDCAAQGTLAADLSLDYSCSGMPPADQTIESFLHAHGFEVANPERVRRQLGARFFPMDIEAIDRRQWTVEFRGLNDSPNPAHSLTTNFTVGVISPPPTVHDAALETAVIALITTQPGCKITSNHHSENPAAAKGMFDFMLTILRNRMHESVICDQTVSTYDAKACDVVPGVKELKAQHS